MDQRLINLGEQAARISRETLVDGRYLMPLKVVYDELVKEGLTPLQDLDQETKEKYWNETIEIESMFETDDVWFTGFKPQLRNTRRIWACQALYVHDLIREQEDERSVANTPNQGGVDHKQKT